MVLEITRGDWHRPYTGTPLVLEYSDGNLREPFDGRTSLKWSVLVTRVLHRPARIFHRLSLLD